MVIYFICGLFAGLLIGSWGAYYALNQTIDAPKTFDIDPKGNDKPETADLEADETERKAEEQRRKQFEGLMNVLGYDGKPQKKDGDAE